LNTFSDLTIGETAEFSRSFSKDDLKLFSELSNDFNPIHMDASFAKSTPFGKQIVHGMLTSSLISGLLGNTLPGAGSVYLSQEFKFLAPVFIDEIITAKVTIIKLISSKKQVLLKTQITNKENIVVVDGEALLLYRN